MIPVLELEEQEKIKKLESALQLVLSKPGELIPASVYTQFNIDKNKIFKGLFDPIKLLRDPIEENVVPPVQVIAPA